MVNAVFETPSQNGFKNSAGSLNGTHSTSERCLTNTDTESEHFGTGQVPVALGKEQCGAVKTIHFLLEQEVAVFVLVKPWRN